MSELLVVGEENLLPTRAYDNDAGFDLFCAEAATVPPHSFVDIPCGVRLASTDPNHVLLIFPRSSTIRKYGLHVVASVIDPGYRGDYFAGVWNLTDREVHVPAGARLAQVVPVKAEAVGMTVRRVEQLDETHRGTNGRGSSGH